MSSIIDRSSTMKTRSAFSILELLLALTVMVVLVTATVVFVNQPRARISNQSCRLGLSELQLRVDEYQRINGRLPSTNLRELVSRTSPLPVCPVDGQPYQLDRTTGLVTVHVHPN